MSGHWTEDEPELRKAVTGEELIGPWGAAPPVEKAEAPQLNPCGRAVCGQPIGCQRKGCPVPGASAR